jgi:CheY-like chemotaxis protein
MPTLLLSDDNATVQRMIAMTFAAEDVTVTAVSDGEQAIARIAAEHPDIVLAATTTPRRNGYDVAAFVKSQPELAAIPVLLLAGAFEPIDEVRAAQVRCDGVLVKPLEPQQVIVRVKELIAGSRGTAAIATSGVPRPLERLVAPGHASGSPRETAPSPSATARQPHSDETLDDYFERLDAAFAQRPGPVPPSRSADSGTVPTLDAVLTAPLVPADSQAQTVPPVVTDALIDEVTRRVVERLSAPALPDVVRRVVGDVAERLIREEIARIRSK